jgi:hypothetical protein
MRGTLAVSVLALTLACVAPSRAADGLLQERSTGRNVFPKNWVSGFVDFAVAPPHNEPDLNRCSSATGSIAGANTGCAAFARYVGSGYIEFRPFGTGPMHRVFVFVEPHAYMGRNRPQFQYTNAMTPIALERRQGIGVNVTRNLELRLTSHRVDWLGHYAGNLGMTDLGKNGPLSTYTTVSARWYFGGYRRRDQGY